VTPDPRAARVGLSKTTTSSLLSVCSLARLERPGEGRVSTPGAGLYEGVERWTGAFWHVVVPGLGTVLVDVGLEIIDWRLLSEGYSPVLKAVGRHQWLEGDFGGLCAAIE
jgi:hypothetical protein